MISLIFIRILEVSLFTSILIAILLALNPLFQKRYSAKWRCFIWLAVSLRLLIPISFTLPKAPINLEIPNAVNVHEQASRADGFEVTAPDPVAFSAVPGASGVQNTGETTNDLNTTGISSGLNSEAAAEPFTKLPPSPVEIAGFIWLFGAAVYLLFQTAVYQVFLRKLRRLKSETVPEFILAALSQTGSELGLRRLPEILITEAVDAPVLVGILRPRILLPITQYDREKLSFILRHELVHFKRGDMFFKLVLIILNALHWFNPLVCLMAAQAAKDIELACDSEVVNGLDDDAISGYGNTILSVMPRKRRPEPMFSTHFGSSKKTMKQRLANLFDTRLKHRATALLCSTIACAVIVTSLVSFSYAADSVPSSNLSVRRLGRFEIESGDVIKSNLSWIGSGAVMVLQTDRDCSNDEILAAIQGVDDRVPELYSDAFKNFIPSGPFNFTLSPKSPLDKEQKNTEPGLYSFYIIEIGFSNIAPLSGSVTRIDAAGGVHELWPLSGNADKQADVSGITSGQEALSPIDISISANAEDGTWAAATAVSGSAWQEQIDSEIQWLNDIYEENKSDFVITEVIPAAEAPNTSRLHYLYDNSDVFRSMSAMKNGAFLIADRESTFWKSGDSQTAGTLHRTAVMSEDDSALALNIDYNLTQGKMAVWLINPDGEIVCQSGFNTAYTNTRTAEGKKGLWSVVRVFDGGGSGKVSGNLGLSLRKVTVSAAPPVSSPPSVSLPQQTFPPQPSPQPSHLFNGGVAPNNWQYGNPFPAEKGDTAIISLNEQLWGWSLDSDEIAIRVVIGGNSGSTQEVVLTNREPEKELTIKETANHHITIYNLNDMMVNYSFLITLDKTSSDSGTDASQTYPAQGYVSPDFGPTDLYSSADDEAITRMNLSGTWGDYIERLLPDMSPETVETVMDIYLDRHLFPGITQPEGARQVAETVAAALEYMSADAREAAEKRIEEYY